MTAPAFECNRSDGNRNMESTVLKVHSEEYITCYMKKRRKLQHDFADAKTN